MNIFSLGCPNELSFNDHERYIVEKLYIPVRDRSGIRGSGAVAQPLAGLTHSQNCEMLERDIDEVAVLIMDPAENKIHEGKMGY